MSRSNAFTTLATYTLLTLACMVLPILIPSLDPAPQALLGARRHRRTGAVEHVKQMPCLLDQLGRQVVFVFVGFELDLVGLARAEVVQLGRQCVEASGLGAVRAARVASTSTSSTVVKVTTTVSVTPASIVPRLQVNVSVGDSVQPLGAVFDT